MADSSRGANAFQGPVGPLVHRCPGCSATGPKLLLCGGCRVVRYCSGEHQAAHRPLHKSACNRVKKARAKLAEEEDRVRNATPDFATPANAFETHAGHFWSIYSTRNYMRARYNLAGKHLLPIGTLDGIKEALAHMQDMLRLSRSDNMGLRNAVSAIMLRLDLDQECYDFVKWWAKTLDGDYQWDDMTAPYLDIHNADVLEDPDFFGKYPGLNHIVAIILLKLKLLVDIRNLKIARKISALHRIPFDVREMIEPAVVRSPLSLKLQKQSPERLVGTEAKLLIQIRRLGALLADTNVSFMFYLFEPDEALSAKPTHYSFGSWEEMALAMQNSYAAWWETEGVLALLNDARACAARDSEDEIEDMMEGTTFKSGGGSDRTAEELLADVSVNRVWGYLDYAMENASYLGPWSERPSERHIREVRESNAKWLAEEAEFEELYGEEVSDSSEDETATVIRF